MNDDQPVGVSTTDRSTALKAKPSLENLLSFCHRRRYPANADIIRPGDAAETLYYVVEGSVAVIMDEAEEGRELVLAYLNAGDFIGEAALFVDQPVRSSTVRTRTPCVLAEVSYRRLRGLLEGPLAKDYADILVALGEQLSRRLMEASRKVGRLAFFDVTGRIARTLLDLCQEPDAMTHPQGMQIRITRQELGRIVGCSREMAGRVLKKLEQEGVIYVKGKTIVVYGAGREDTMQGGLEGVS